MEVLIVPPSSLTTKGEYDVKAVIAVVQDVRDGPHGHFAIATAEGFEGSITFSLTPKVWQESDVPESGTEVVLSDLRRKRQGWRAMNARYVRPHDQQTALSNNKEKEMGFDQEYRSDVREGVMAGKWTVWKVMFAVIPLVIFLSILGYAFGWFGEAASVIQDEFGPEAAVYKYEWFHDKANNLNAAEQRIGITEDALAQFKEDLKEVPRGDWSFDDKQENSRLTTDLRGQKAHFEQLKAEFRAAAQKVNYSIFKSDSKIIRWADELVGTEE